MGKLHSRAYQAIPLVYPELKIRPRLIHAADTAADRADYARDVLGLRQGQHRLPGRARRSRRRRGVHLRAEHAAPGDRRRGRAGGQAVLDREAGRPGRRRDRRGRRRGRCAAGVATSIGYNYRHVPAVERARELIAAGDLGRITNVRAVFFNGYASEPNGALSWRFKKDLAGSGALGDLLSHVVDLMQYVVGADHRGQRACCPPCTSNVRCCRWDRPRTSP